MTETPFREAVAASFPAGLALPQELVRLFDWMEQGGLVGRYARSGGRYAGLYPVDDPAAGMCQVAFHPVDPAHIAAWMGRDEPAITDRLAVFLRTGGDGSAAGLWRDDEGRTHFVHLGSGSGSTLACVLATQPVDFLRLLAIGYLELCWAEDYGRTPADVHDHSALSGEAYRPPERFRAWVETSFDVSVPQTASEIVANVAHLGDMASQDPFCRWLERIQEW